MSIKSVLNPQRSEEHENPHLVAGWRAPIEPFAERNGNRDFRRLVGLLNAPLQAIHRCGKPGTVWHCVFSAAPTDRLLTDTEWTTLATGFMHRMGLAPRDDPYGIRWVAVRHGLSKGGIDHIHIAATLARQDSTAGYPQRLPARPQILLGDRGAARPDPDRAS
jgi:hypothetical protein